MVTDDTDDKIRRNLVFFSALVLGLWFLGLPFETVVKKVGGDGVIVRPDRVLGVGLSVLAYFMARFRFSKEGEALVKGVREQSEEFTREHLLWFANREARAWIRRGTESSMLEPSLTEAFRRRLIKNENARPVAVVLQLGTEKRSTPLELAVVIQWADDKETGGGSAGNTMVLQHGWKPQVARLAAGVRAITYSKVALVSVMPLMLAAASLAVLWLRIIHLYGAAWR